MAGRRRGKRRLALALLLVVAVLAACLPFGGAVDVGDDAESACPNATTVTLYNATKAAAAQITTSDCDDTVVKVQTAEDGSTVLDLRRKGIRIVKSLPEVDIVKLDNNQVESFETEKSITYLFLTNNSIDNLEPFDFPDSLRTLDLSDNDLGGIDDATFPSSLQYLNLSSNPLGSLQNTALPSSLIELNCADGSLATLENFSFPSSITSLNFSINPITRIAGVIFPSDLMELTIVAMSTTSSVTVASTLTYYTSEATSSVLEEFEVRQTDATLFKDLVLFDVSTTSTLECSDALASPYYVQDTMLCVLSDSDFAAKYAKVIESASNSSYDWSGVGSDASSSQEMVLPTLKETLKQKRSWFMMVSAAILTAILACFCLSGCCAFCRRRASRPIRAGKTATKPVQTIDNVGRMWQNLGGSDNNDDVETQQLIDRMMAASPHPDEEEAAEPLAYLERYLREYAIAPSKLTQQAPIHPRTEIVMEPKDDHRSRFEYSVAVYRHRKIALKKLFIRHASPSSHRDKDNDDREDVSSGKTLTAFVQEIYLSSTLSHPNIIGFVGYVLDRRHRDASPEAIALAMDYMDRGDLDAFIQARKLSLESGQPFKTSGFDKTDLMTGEIKAVTWEDATEENATWSWRYSTSAFKSKLAIAIDVARALEHLHSLSPPLFHGNLSSRKVLFDKQWTVKLGDFTSCSALRRWSSTLDKDDSSLDSPDSRDSAALIHLNMSVWSAPEVVDGRQYTEQSDIYSFGILLSQLDSYDCPADMQPVIDDADVPLLISNPRYQQVTPDGDAPSLVRLLTLQCRAFQPEDRPTASEALHQLLRIEQEFENASTTSATSFY